MYGDEGVASRRARLTRLRPGNEARCPGSSRRRAGRLWRAWNRLWATFSEAFGHPGWKPG